MLDIFQQVLHKFYQILHDCIENIVDNVNNKFDYFLNNHLSGQTNNILVTINGSTLIPTTEYYVSIVDDTKLILNVPIYSGDSLQVYYSQNSIISGNTSVINITTNPFNFSWNIPSNVLYDGSFTLEFSNNSDPNFNTIVLTASTSYTTGDTSYTIVADFTQPVFNILTLGSIYNVRINSTKQYVTINNLIINSTTYSDVLKVKIPT